MTDGLSEGENARRALISHREEIIGLGVHGQGAAKGRVVLEDIVDVIRERAPLLRRVASRYVSAPPRVDARTRGPRHPRRRETRPA